MTSSSIPYHAWIEASKDLANAIERYLDTSAALESAISRPFEHVLNDAALEEVVSAVRADRVSAESRNEKLGSAGDFLTMIQNRSTKIVPIHSLPLEILVHIFALAGGQDCCLGSMSAIFTRRQSDATLLALTRVCGDWRRLCISTPVLWSHVDILDYGPQNTSSNLQSGELWLERARQCTSLSAHVSVHHSDPSWALTTLVRLRPHLKQISSFGFESTGYNSNSFLQQALRFWLANGEPGSVRALVLTGPKPIYSNPQKQHFEIPSLPPDCLHSFLAPIQVLRLRNASFEWESAVYHALVNLELSSVPPVASPTLQQMVHILSSCPDLHTLKLDEVAIWKGEEPSVQPVALNKLQVLDIAGMSPLDCSILLPVLAPGLGELSVRISLRRDLQNADALMSFFGRSNVVVLFLQTYAQGSLVAQYLAPIKNLRILALDFGLPQIARCNSVLDALMHPPNSSSMSHTSRWPSLHTLYLINGTFSVDVVRTVVETYCMRKLRLAGVQEPTKEKLLGSIESILEDVKFSAKLDDGFVSDWYLHMY